MQLKLLNKKEDKVTFLITDTEAYIVNALRRMIIEEVPTMAIEEVTFSKNQSALYDEIIAHRLGLVVLKTDLEAWFLYAGIPARKIKWRNKKAIIMLEKRFYEKNK